MTGGMAGVLGFAGKDGPNQQNIYSRRAGVMGASDAFTGVAGASLNRPGVVGTSDQLPGVIGTSKAHIGVFGFSNNVGVVGLSTNPASFAGYFNGNVVVVNGALTASVKNALVTFPDRTQRVLHCMESPEHWFEDFGTAKLKNGRATVKLDGDFAKVIKPTGYHVFVTPEGDCRGLYVRGKTAASFEVRELSDGKSSVAFSYRIVGRRRDITRHRRFAKIDTRLPLPAAASRAPRQRKPNADALREFITGLEREARTPTPTPTSARRRPKSPPPAKIWTGA